MLPPDPPKTGEPPPEDPGHGIADCYRAIEDEPDAAEAPIKGREPPEEPQDESRQDG
jgi:hypothetical protein